MEIVILAIGSRGDVQPLVALGLGLQAAGHQVCVATHATFETMVRNSGLRFSLLQVNPKELMEGEAGQAAMEGGGNPLSSLQDFARMIKPAILQTGADCWAACQGADLILYSPLGFYGAPDIAEKLNIPAIGAWLQPDHRTSAFPSYALPRMRNLGGFANRLTYLLTDALLWLPFRSAVNQVRQEKLDLPPISPWVNYRRRWQQHMPVIYGFSPLVVPKPSDWGDHIEITGYWFLDKRADWQPPPDMVDFLEAGPAPVYIGFGSMSSRSPDETTDIALKALGRIKQRGLFVTGWGGLGAIDLPSSAFMVESVPHDWLFPKMAAVVHHGGAGTTAAGLLAGVPSVIVPHFTDQLFWARRVSELGVGPQSIPRNQLSVARLADALQEAVSSSVMRRRVTVLGERIRHEDGVACAVEAIHNFVAGL